MPDDLVEVAVDRAGEEVAHGHAELSETILLAPFLLAGVKVPQIRQLTADRIDRTGTVQVTGRAEPVAVQLEIGEPVSQARPDRTGDGQRGELRVLRVGPGRASGLRHPPRS